MGMVFEAVQESLGRRVALKVLPGDFALDPKRVERFRREARATARIHHPSIVPVYEVGEAEGTHFYAMEFLEGRSLDQLIEAARRTPAPRRKPGSSTASDPAYIARAVESMAALAEGLEEAHRLGLIHRDVKPSNILVDGDGRWVLVDFGLVHEAEAKTITRSGEMVGTLSYMSPEQVSRGRVDARADVYSLGVTLYEVLALRTPYAGTSDHEIQRAILFEEPLPPRKLNPRLHRDLETILLHALEKNPERRYASAREFAADLRRFLRYEPIRARAVSLPERLYRWCRNRAALVAVLAVVVACGLTTGLLLWKSRGAEFERERAESEAKFGAAERLYGEGRYQEALARLDEALAKKLAPLESRLLHAKVLGDMGRAAEAISELEGLAREKPGEGAVHALLAALYRGSDSRKADEHQALAEKFLPKEADAFFLRAIGSGSLKESLGFLTAALDEDPGHYASLKARAIAHQAQRDYSAMERDADRMTALRRQDPVGWTLHGVALRELGRLDEALRDLDRAARLAPADPEVLDHRREAHSLKGSNDQALADARRCAELRPNEVRYRFQVFKEASEPPAARVRSPGVFCPARCGGELPPPRIQGGSAGFRGLETRLVSRWDRDRLWTRVLRLQRARSPRLEVREDAPPGSPGR